MLRVYEKTISLVLEKLTVIQLSAAHFSTLLNSSLIPTSVIFGTKRLVSSAYLKRRLLLESAFIEVTLHDSIKHGADARTLNNTSVNKFGLRQLKSICLTCWVLPVRKEKIQDKITGAC